MLLRKYRKEDYKMICSWYEKRGSRAPSESTLSDLGWIADDRVAGWLYITNSNMAMIEGIVSDPDTVPSLRRESLEKLCAFMVDVSMSLGYTHIFGITRHPSIDRICQKLGFKSGDFKIWMLNESDEPEEYELVDEELSS